MFKLLRYTFALCLGLAMPVASWAFTADLQSITPEPQMDISSMITGTPERVVVAGWLFNQSDIDNAVEYTAVFTADESPAGVITPGGDNINWVYSAEAGTVTVTFTPTGMKAVGDSPDNAGMIALVGVANTELGEDGPPTEMTGFYLSTNVQDWELIPPSPDQDSPAFGFSLTGPTGETGFLHMFMPTGIKDLLSQYSGKELTWDDLAVFNGDSQSSLSLTEVEGGAYIDINVVFSDSVTTTPSATNSSILKEITVQEQLPVSLAASKTTVAKNKTVKLYGWLKNGQANQTVSIWRKQAGEKTYTKLYSTATNNSGYYHKTVTLKKTTKYKVKYRHSGKTTESSVQTVTVS